MADPHIPSTPPSPRGWALPEVGGTFDDPGGFGPAPGGPAGAPGGPLGPDLGPHDAPDGRARLAAVDVAANAGPIRLPVPLKPLTMSDLLDGAWGVIKARPRTVFAVTAAIVIPVQLVVALMQRGFARSVDFTTLFSNSTFTSTRGPTAGGLGLAYLGVALSSLSYWFLGGAIAKLVSSWYAGIDLSAKDALLASLRKAPVFIAAFFLLLVPKVVSVAFCYVGAFFVIPLLMLTVPAIMIEDLGPVAGARRSWTLVSRRLFPCIGLWFMAWLVEFLVNTVLALIPELLAQFLPGEIGDLLQPAGNAFAHFVTAPVVVGFAVLLYLDLRIRTEGLDVELSAADAFARAA